MTIAGGRGLRLLALLALAGCVVVFLRRLAAVDEAALIAPGAAQTSGCEEESFNAVWKAVHGQPVYGDVTRPPFAAAYFNWLFYRFYGTLIAPAVAACGDASLPLAGHWLTGLLAALGAYVCIRACARHQSDGPTRIAAGALGAFLFLGPLVGWWGVTLRPDVAALLAETAGLLAFLRWHRTHPTRAMTAAIGAGYVAWAFKPTALGMLAAVGAFLLLRRRWRDAVYLGAATAVLWMLTLAAGGAAFRASLFDTATDNAFSPGTGLTNLWQAVRALSPLLVGLPWWYAALRRHHAWRQTSPAGDALLLATAGVPIAVVASAVAASKIGASGNYFFSVALLLTAGTALGVWRLERSRVAPALACVVILVLQGGTLAGSWGRLSLRAGALRLAERWDEFRRLPEPRFSSDLRLNLPWLNPHSPPLVLAYNYPRDRMQGRRFAGNGLGGMIQRGELISLLLPASTKTAYDGAPLANYRRTKTVAGMAVYRLARQPLTANGAKHGEARTDRDRGLAQPSSLPTTRGPAISHHP